MTRKTWMMIAMVVGIYILLYGAVFGGGQVEQLKIVNPIEFKGYDNPRKQEDPLWTPHVKSKAIDPMRVIVQGYYDEGGYVTLTGEPLAKLNRRNLITKEEWEDKGKIYYLVQEGEQPLGYLEASRLVEWFPVDKESFRFNQYKDYAQSLASVAYDTEEEFIRMLVRYASLAKNVGVHPSVMIGQALLESGGGVSLLAKRDRNLFGIKGDYKGHRVLALTQEDSSLGMETMALHFRTYPSYYESVVDYLALLTEEEIYQHVPYAPTPYQQIEAIVNGGYATDRSYVDKVLSVIERYNLTQYD